MSGAWNHPQCEACWIGLESRLGTDGVLVIPKPHRLRDPEPATCCWCNRLTISGIFRRINPNALPTCARDHDDEEDTP